MTTIPPSEKIVWDMHDLKRVTGFSDTYVRTLMETEEFPRPIIQGKGRRVVWDPDKVRAWVKR